MNIEYCQQQINFLQSPSRRNKFKLVQKIPNRKRHEKQPQLQLTPPHSFMMDWMSLPPAPIMVLWILAGIFTSWLVMFAISFWIFWISATALFTLGFFPVMVIMSLSEPESGRSIFVSVSSLKVSTCEFVEFGGRNSVSTMSPTRLCFQICRRVWFWEARKICCSRCRNTDNTGRNVHY